MVLPISCIQWESSCHDPLGIELGRVSGDWSTQHPARPWCIHCLWANEWMSLGVNSWETRRHSSRQDGQGIHRGMKGPGGRPLGPKCQGPGLAWHFVWLCCFFVDLSPSFLSPLTFAREREDQGSRKAGKVFYWPEFGKASYSCFINMSYPLVGDGSSPPGTSRAL